MKTDLVLDRADQGLCPICKKPIGIDFKTIEYKGKKIWVCREHPTEG